MSYDRTEDLTINASAYQSSSQAPMSYDGAEDLTVNASYIPQTPQQQQYATINGFRIGKCIGAGGFSKRVDRGHQLGLSADRLDDTRVFQAFRHDGDGQGAVAACKVVSLQAQHPQEKQAAPDMKELQKEVQVHKILKHRYILELLDSKVVKPDTVEAGVWIVPGLYILLELALGGDLFDKIAPDVGIAEDLAKHYFQQLCAGLEFIHSRGICHRDLKPENLLLSIDGDIKISDFGLCAVWQHKGKTRLLSGRCGSLPYVAPELNQPAQYEAVPVDMWGAGVVLFTLLVGNTPWDEPSRASPEFAAYLTGELLQYSPWTNIQGHARSLLLGLLNVDPTARLTMEQVQRHPWFMRPSQIRKQELPRMLTQGIREAGMMDMIQPPKNSQAHRDIMQSQQYSQISSQFMIEAAVTSTIGGTIRNYNTLSRFWLDLSLEDTYTILAAVFAEAAAQGNLRYGPDENAERGRNGWRLSLLDNRKQPLVGRVVLEGEEDMTLVLLERSKGDPLSWKRFWWSLTKHANLRERIINTPQRS